MKRQTIRLSECTPAVSESDQPVPDADGIWISCISLSDGRGFIYLCSGSALSTAENILMMLRKDKKYTKLEAKILDMALVLHMDHGGGNNSTFTTHVVTSSGTDTYSTMAAAMASLKGPKHGGANIKVTQMFEDMKQHLTDWEDRDEVKAYLEALLDKKAFDQKGLIYGMGHAVYSISDPRQISSAHLLHSWQEKSIVRRSMLFMHWWKNWHQK